MAKRGPKTKAGKAAVRLNAVRHGVLSTTPVIPNLESEEEWQAHRAAILEAVTPEGQLEWELAERAAFLLWRLQRVGWYERECIALSQERANEDLLGAHPEVVEEARQGQRLREERLRLLGRMLHLPDDAPLPTEEAATMLLAVAVAGGVDLAGISLPGLPEGLRPEEFSAWTVGLLRQAIAATAIPEQMEPAELMAEVVHQAVFPPERWRELSRKLTVDLDRMRRERLLPDDITLNKIVRYEAHLHRQLLQTLHELEALQARRHGEQAPLARLDVQGVSEG